MSRNPRTLREWIHHQGLLRGLYWRLMWTPNRKPGKDTHHA